MTIQKQTATPSPVQYIGLYMLVGLLVITAVPHAIAVLIMDWGSAMLNVQLAASVIVYLAAWRAEIEWRRAHKSPRRKHKRTPKAANAAAWEDLKRRFEATE